MPDRIDTYAAALLIDWFSGKTGRDYDLTSCGGGEPPEPRPSEGERRHISHNLRNAFAWTISGSPAAPAAPAGAPRQCAATT